MPDDVAQKIYDSDRCIECGCCVASCGAANVNQLLNADQVNGYGLETEFDLLVTENLFVSANLSYNDTEIDDPGLGCGPRVDSEMRTPLQFFIRAAAFEDVPICKRSAF